MNYLLIIPLLLIFFTGKAQTPATLSGRITGNDTNTIQLMLNHDEITRTTEKIMIPLDEDHFQKIILVKKITPLYIKDGKNYINGLIAPGDELSISYDKKNVIPSLIIEGKGKEKFELMNSLIGSKLNDRLKEQAIIARKSKFPFDHLFQFLENEETIFTSGLDLIKPRITKEEYNYLLGEIRGRFLTLRYYATTMVYHETPAITLSTRQQELKPVSGQTIANLLHFENTFSASPAYVNAVYSILFMHYDGLLLANKVSKNLAEKYSLLNKLLPSTLRVPVLTLFLENDLGKTNQGEDIDAIVQKTYIHKTDSIYKKHITALLDQAVSFRKGIQAPDFSLQKEDGSFLHLADLRGKVVYLDFWYGACVPCLALFKQVAPAKTYFKDNPRVVFLYVSIDKKETWLQALKKQEIQGLHVFTGNKEADHPVIAAYKVMGYPTTFLIDKNGKTFLATPSNDPTTLIQEIEAALRVQ